MKSVVHVHQQKMRQGLPAVIVRTYKGSERFRRVYITGPCVVVQSDTPDRCGARVWIETQGDVVGV